MSIEPEESSEDRHSAPERLVPWALAVLTLAITVAGVLRFPPAKTPQTDLPAYLAFVLAVLWVIAASVIGAMITSNRRGNRIGWLLVGVGLLLSSSFILAGAGETEHPAADALNLLSDLGWILSLSLSALLILLFPDGRPLSRRWRPMVWFTTLWGSIFWFMGVVLAPEDLLAETPPVGPPQVALAVLLLLTFTGVAISAFLRFARSRGVERQQLKWFAYATGVGVAMSVLGIFLPPWGKVIANLGLFGPLVGIAIALFRHRLYDIDVLISRTFVYGALVAILAGLYSASIRLFNALFVGATGLSSEEVLVITTLILATTFTPIKKRLEDIVERRYKKPAEAAAVSSGAIASDLVADPAFFAAIDGRLRAIVRDELKRSGRAR
jgi:hypothetical protein